MKQYTYCYTIKPPFILDSVVLLSLIEGASFAVDEIKKETTKILYDEGNLQEKYLL